jgi:hypothetical protein
LCNYDFPLKADTHKDYQNITVGTNQSKFLQNPTEMTAISEASKYLKGYVIPELVSMLDDLRIMPIDSESLCQVFHKHGVNMRYLSHAACLTEVPHVREICITEMFSRTLKNIMNLQMSQLILDNKKEYHQFKSLLKKEKALI